MSTIFNSQRTDISATGLTQTKSYNEGDAELLLDTMTFDNSNDYTDVVTLTLDIAGGDPSQFTLTSTTEVAPIVATDADTYTITSQYVKSNYTQNIQADVASTIANLKLTFDNTDASESYVITVTLSDGHSSTVGTITVTGFAVVDATNITQNLTATEDQYVWQFTTKPQVADLDEAGRTYRVTLTSPNPERAVLYSTASVITTTSGVMDNEVIFEGTQAQVNAALNNTDGNIYILQGPDNTAAYSINYTQEVIAGATGVPYTQETGQFNFTISASDSANTVVSGIFYSEDVTTTPGSIATINDSRDFSLTPTLTTKFNASITFADTAAVTSVPNWTETFVGSGVYTLTEQSRIDIISRLNTFSFVPGADYITTASPGMYLTVTRDNQQGDATWYDTGWTTQQTIINNVGIDLVRSGADHPEYTISATVNTGEYSVTNLNLGSNIVSDLAVDKQYTITLVLSSLIYGTIGAPWVLGTPGTYTLSGTKTYLNTQLTTVPFDTTILGDDVNTGSLTMSYQQQQTTDGIDQGYTGVAATINIVGVVDATDITQTGIVITEDEQLFEFSTVPQIADQLGAGSGRTYRVTMSPATGADDVYDMWTDSIYVVGSVYSSTMVFEGTQAQINTALTSNWHLDRTTIDDTADFTINWLQEVITGATGVPYTQETGSFAFDVTPDVDAGYTVDTTYNNWNVDTATALKTIATITDTRGDQYDAATVLYRATIQTDTPVTNTDGALSSAGTGGTSVWDGTDTLTMEGTKTQVNSHLAALTWTGTGGFSNAFTMNTELLRNINSAGWLTHKSVTNILMNSGDGATGQNTGHVYNEDEILSL